MEPEDKLSLEVLQEMPKNMNSKYMTTNGKKDAKSKVFGDSMHKIQQIFGLKLGSREILNHSQDILTNKVILLLTDGVPNVNPPYNDYKTALANYKSKYYININTFGFGYNLDSKILNDIANFSNGFYNFIPDASFVWNCICKYHE